MYKISQFYKNQHCSVLLGNTEIMTHMNTFLSYLDSRFYHKSTIARHKSYLIYFSLRLLENNLEFDIDWINRYAKDMCYYTSNNTVRKYLSSISLYIHFQKQILDKEVIRKERIEYPKHENKYWYWFYQNQVFYSN